MESNQQRVSSLTLHQLEILSRAVCSPCQYVCDTGHRMTFLPSGMNTSIARRSEPYHILYIEFEDNATIGGRTRYTDAPRKFSRCNRHTIGCLARCVSAKMLSVVASGHAYCYNNNLTSVFLLFRTLILIGLCGPTRMFPVRFELTLLD